MRSLLWILVMYVAIGILVTAMLSQTPYSDNPWWVTTLLWPVFVFALMF